MTSVRKLDPATIVLVLMLLVLPVLPLLLNPPINPDGNIISAFSNVTLPLNTVSP